MDDPEQQVIWAAVIKSGEVSILIMMVKTIKIKKLKLEEIIYNYGNG